MLLTLSQKMFWGLGGAWTGGRQPSSLAQCSLHLDSEAHPFPSKPEENKTQAFRVFLHNQNAARFQGCNQAHYISCIPWGRNTDLAQKHDNHRFHSWILFKFALLRSDQMPFLLLLMLFQNNSIKRK